MTEGAWNKAKTEAFAAAFYQFINHVRINSKDKGSDYILGSGLYLAQKRVLEAIWSGLERDVHDVKVLKGRQAGISTLIRALAVFWLGFHKGMVGAMVFDSEGHTSGARQEVEDMIDNLPKFLGFPEITNRNRYGIRLANQSRLMFMSAGTRQSQSSGVLGRSSGINLLWASEMCSWINEGGVQALKNALSTRFEDRLFMWESTARGPNVWKTMWDEAQVDDLNQVAVFIGWWANDALRIEENDRRFPFYGLEPPNTEERQRIAEVKKLYDYDVTQEQLAWYRYYIDPGREREEGEPQDTYKLEDQPWTSFEAFQLTGSTFFDGSTLMRHQMKAVTFRYKSFKWLPASDDGGFFKSRIEPAFTGRDTDLRVWEEPLPTAQYVIACDPAFGHSEKSDHSAIEALRCYADCIEQVAEFQSTSTPTHQLAWMVIALEAYYGSFSGNIVHRIIEINGPGEAVWREIDQTIKIIRSGYLGQAAREAGLADIGVNSRNYIYTRSDSMTAGHALMFKTQQQLKVAIMERLRDFIHNGGILIRSKEVLEEMTGVTRDGDKIGAEGSNRDDRTVALALGVRCWEERVRRALVGQGLTRERDHARRAVSSPADRLALMSTFMLQDMLARKRGAALMNERQMRLQQSRLRMRDRQAVRTAGALNAPWRTRI
jgi:hypothetical protein